jgi:XTP/dITP diphosphohydrolase
MARAVLLASNNAHKLREFRAYLEPHGFRVLSPSDLGISLSVAETGSTFAENALLKAKAFHDSSKLITLADDSGLIVDALNGEPGAYSARYGGERASDSDRTQLVLRRLRAVPEPLRTARFVATIAVVCPGGHTQVFEKTAEGMIATEPRGHGGFGYDPIFLYAAAGRTFAEMSSGEKAEVSHRGKALAALVVYLLSGECDAIIAQTLG